MQGWLASQRRRHSGCAGAALNEAQPAVDGQAEVVAGRGAQAARAEGIAAAREAARGIGRARRRDAAVAVVAEGVGEAGALPAVVAAAGAERGAARQLATDQARAAVVAGGAGGQAERHAPGLRRAAVADAAVGERHRRGEAALEIDAHLAAVAGRGVAGAGADARAERAGAAGHRPACTNRQALARVAVGVVEAAPRRTPPAVTVIFADRRDRAARAAAGQHDRRRRPGARKVTDGVIAFDIGGSPPVNVQTKVSTPATSGTKVRRQRSAPVHLRLRHRRRSSVEQPLIVNAPRKGDPVVEGPTELSAAGIERRHRPVEIALSSSQPEMTSITKAKRKNKRSQSITEDRRAERPVQRCDASASPTARRIARSAPTRTTSCLPRVTAV